MSEKPFQIVDYIPPLTVDFSNNSTWEVSATSEYRNITLTGPDGFVYQSQIDIAGWTRQGLTAFFANQFIQRDGPYTCFTALPAPPAEMNVDTQSARDYVIITDVPLPLSNTIIHAAFMDQTSEYMTIKYARADIFVQSSTSPVVMIPADSWGTGSGEPTASGTLYVTRICVPHKATPGVTDFVDFPALRYVAQGIATEEAEFVYMTRLRRSFELRES